MINPEHYWNREAVRTLLSSGYKNLPGWEAKGMDAVLDAIEEHIIAAPLNLHDPATANAVADAIVRYKGCWVPLDQAYPWVSNL